MSVDGQVLGANDGDIANVDASKTHNPGLEDVDLYGASASGIANTSASGSSLVRETVSNTRSNAQRPPEHLRTVEPTFVNENAGDIPFVHSPLLLPSQDMPLEVPYNGNVIAANNPSSRKNAIASQRSDLRQDAKAGHPRRNSDKTSTSSPSRKESSSRRDSGRPESAHPDAPPSRHFLEHQPNESQSYSRNIHEDSRHHPSHRRSSHTAPAIPANPYAGAGLYPTPPMYASPLSIPQYGLPPPIGHSHAYPPVSLPYFCLSLTKCPYYSRFRQFQFTLHPVYHQ
ncbi:hypothetical protein BDN70DRAFT_700307 [Pholiota conissans]|uniref:Uncharacterized protein n=1 Tax=Pholiota conissans TaxID=109636 RepID=A0A9P6CTF0_9AGAR|nr:hypothetical protein BDN70DRAFT_700307 [Pholiota conissans]